MKKKLGIIVLVCVMGMVLIPKTSFGLQSNEKVSLPEFKITLNGQVVQNITRQYPFIVYKGTTYFPMTYYDCKFLGLESLYTQEGGLDVKKTGVSAAYRDYATKTVNGKSYLATIPNFKVIVNGKTVQNEKEEYPVLIFRNITYFPMTWNYSVNEFGWDYRYEANTGLKVDSANNKVTKVSLPATFTDLRPEDENFGEHVVYAKGNYYYGGEKGGIYQANASDLTKVKKVYDLPIYSYGDGKAYVIPDFSIQNNDVILNYHQGGAVMGSDFKIKINPDGTTKELMNGYYKMGIFGDTTVSYYVGQGAGANNLTVKHGDGEEIRIGDPACQYGNVGWWECPMYLQGDELYILAKDKSSEQNTSGVYRLNIKSGQTVRLSEKPASYFVLQGKQIFFANDTQLYKMPITGGNEVMIPAKPMQADYGFAVSNGEVYYVYSQDGQLYKAGSDISLNQGALVNGLAMKNGYVVATFEETAQSKYRILAFDSNGKNVFQSSDVAQLGNISIENGKIYYFEKSLKKICIGDLM